jgi:hypothetical protein
MGLCAARRTLLHSRRDSCATPRLRAEVERLAGRRACAAELLNEGRKLAKKSSEAVPRPALVQHSAREFFRRSRPSCRMVPTVPFGGTSCPVGLIEPIETQDHDEVEGR